VRCSTGSTKGTPSSISPDGRARPPPSNDDRECNPPVTSRSEDRNTHGMIPRMNDEHLVDFERLTADLDAQATAYQNVSPFPHVVLDDVLTHEAFKQAAVAFAGIDDALWKGYLHVNETKYCNGYPDTWADSLTAIARELTSPAFVSY